MCHSTSSGVRHGFHAHQYCLVHQTLLPVGGARTGGRRKWTSLTRCLQAPHRCFPLTLPARFYCLSGGQLTSLRLYRSTWSVTQKRSSQQQSWGVKTLCFLTPRLHTCAHLQRRPAFNKHCHMPSLSSSCGYPLASQRGCGSQ